jgi:4-methyl-5(b-hydroxyethyl)-thiazole monophosphate biosynthesis
MDKQTEESNNKKQVKAVVLVAPGFEEVETVTPIDFLRRAAIEVDVLSVGVDGLGPIQGSRGIKLYSDSSIEAYSQVPDCVVIPGGLQGAKNLSQSKLVGMLIEKVLQDKGLVASICASPALVLAPLGVLKNHRFTCAPGFETKVQEGAWEETRVVVSGNLITSRGAGTAGEFSLRIIEYLMGSEIAQEVQNSTLSRS